MKKQILFLLAALSIGIHSCKDKDEVDACVKNFVGNWSCNLERHNSSGGFCSTNVFEIEIRPGDNACEVFLPNLPYTSCSNSNYLVKGTVKGDSLFVYSQPYGLYTVIASARVYLNQITCTVNLSDGTIHTLSGSKID